MYKGKISHKYIRTGLKLPDSVRLKLNGTFKRWLYLIDENDCLYRVRYKVQTAAWYNDKTEKWEYVSIFPNFIKRWCQPCLNLLEYIACEVGKGEDIFSHIDDPEVLLPCEDCIAEKARNLEIQCAQNNYEALLNSRYTLVFNRYFPQMNIESTENKRFPSIYSLVLAARCFFGISAGALSLVNTIIGL